MRRELVPIVTPLLNFARDRARRLSDAHAFPVLPEVMTISEAQFHLAHKGLPPQTIKTLQVCLSPTPNAMNPNPETIEALAFHRPRSALLPCPPGRVPP